VFSAKEVERRGISREESNRGDIKEMYEHKKEMLSS
jgi:hypothetical protein